MRTGSGYPCIKLLSSVVIVGLIAIVPIQAATRLTYEISGGPRSIAWDATAFPIALAVAPEVGSSAGPVMGQALDAWSSGSGGSVSFAIREATGLSAGKDGTNAVFVNDRLLSENGVLAFTTTWFDDDGRIIESDIQIDRSQKANLGALITHELGHTLGLDHSAHLSSAMYPYVPEAARLRLDLDDHLVLRTMYPGAATGGAVNGIVQTASGPTWGAQVVALDGRGQPVATTLSDRDGTFHFAGLPAGDYSLYAEPLDGPVSPNNFSGVWRGIPRKPFRTSLPTGGEVKLADGQSIGGIVLSVADGTSELNPRWIGRIDPAAGEVVLDSMAVEVSAGERFGLAVGGDGFVSGMTEFRVHGDEVTRISEFHYGANYVWAEFEVSRDAEARSAIVIVGGGNEQAALTGGLRIEARAPSGRGRSVGRP